MWAEAQLDRRRFKEEQLSRTQAVSLGRINYEGTNTNIAFEGGQSPFVGMHMKGIEASIFPQILSLKIILMTNFHET